MVLRYYALVIFCLFDTIVELHAMDENKTFAKESGCGFRV
jgi:hypothetical protein